MPSILPSDIIAIIDRYFPWTRDWSHQIQARDQTRFKAPEILPGLLSLVGRIPEELLVLDSASASQFILATEALHERMDAARNSELSFGWPTLSESVDCLSVVRENLSRCPDEAPSQSVIELTFITDEQFRQTLAVDLGSAERALHGNEWKAATVLAGSVIEALLLWALQQHTASEISTAVAKAAAAGKVSSSLPAADLVSPDWALHQYIEVAYVIGEIKEHTANPCQEAKYYRNPIDPAAAERDKEKCTRGKAHGALGAVYSVIDDLEERVFA